MVALIETVKIFFIYVVRISVMALIGMGFVCSVVVILAFIFCCGMGGDPE